VFRANRWALAVATFLPALVLAQGATVVARGDAAWDAKRYPEALAAYDSVVRADSAASSRAVYRLAVLRSWNNELREAIALHRLYVRLEPRDLEGLVGLARVYAWDSRFATSVATYDSVLAREADYRDAAFGRATALAWWGKLDASVAAYDAWIRTHANDTEAELGRARVLSWAGRLDEALAVYERVAARSGAAAEAEKGIARVTGWSGDLERSEELWRAMTAKYPDDPETWVGLGQVLRWLGRPFAARDALDQALKLRPQYDDARSQLRWVRAETGWSVSPTFTATTDSEYNDGTVFSIGADGSLGEESRVNARAVFRSNSSPVASGASQTVRVGAQWQPNRGRTTLRADIGAAQVSFTAPGGVNRRFSPFVGGARAGAQVTTRVTVSGGVARDAFDDIVTTMREELVLTTADGDITVSLPSRVSLFAYLASSSAAGDTGESNSRLTVGGSARWTVRRGIALSLNARTASWSHPAFGSYFAPQWFSVAELAGRWERHGDLGLIASAEAAVGRQSIRFEQDPSSSQMTPRISGTLGWRAAPGREVMLTGLVANVASPGTVAQSDYQYSAFTISARFTR
jgi:tetratricopeptide (TPR) repeat protein